MSATEPFFFLSYADVGGDRAPVMRLFSDLQAEVFGRLGRSPGHRGVLKRPRPAGGSPGPDPAVFTARLMVALYSDAYVRSPACAAEWSVFHERRVRWRQRTGQLPPNLVGVWWTHGMMLPRVVEDSGGVDTARDEPDARTTAHNLGLPDTDWTQYRDLVRRIADAMVAESTVALPPLNPREIASVPPLFGPDRVASQRHAPGAPTEPQGGPTRWSFTEAARRRSLALGARPAVHGSLDDF